MRAWAVEREAWRCLGCWDAPCTAACPVHVPVPQFISRVRTGDLEGAERLVRDANPLISTCGQLCPQEQYCARACVLAGEEGPVPVRLIHAFVTSATQPHQEPVEPWRSARVAVLGGGPAGLSCARDLARAGFAVDLYEASEQVGGLVRWCVAPARFSLDYLQEDLRAFQALPVRFHLGRAVAVRHLLDRYDAVFYAPGAGREVHLGIPGEGAVLSGLECLRAWREGRGVDVRGKEVVVIGGGNVSLDVALTAVAEGASRVVVTYRRGPLQMRAWERELEACLRAGVSIEYYATPVAVLFQDGGPKAVQFARTRLDDAQRATPLDGFDFMLPAHVVIRAVGWVPLPPPELYEVWGAKGTLPVSASMQTGLPSLFAGGDVVSTEGTVVAAVSHGVRAARAMAAWLEERG